MKVIAVTQARTASTRLPNKVLLEIEGQSLLEIHLNRLAKAKTVDEVLVATTASPGDEAISNEALRLGFSYYRGSEDDVLDRYFNTVQYKKPAYVVRVTSDCPLVDPELLDQVVQFTIDNNLDYGANILKEHYPDGQDVEVMRFQALEKAWREAKLPSEREHVTPYIRTHCTFNGGELFEGKNFDAPKNLNHVRMTVDEPADFEFMKNLIAACGTNKTWLEYVEYIEQHPELSSINSDIVRNEGYLKSIKDEKSE